MMKTYVVLFVLVVSLCSSANSYELVGVMLGESSGDQYGRAFCNLDFNDDGYQDLVASAPAADYAGTSSGRIYIYYGGPGADMVADLIIDGSASSFFGKALASAGDFNGDGVEDLLVGAPFYDVPATSAGAAYLYYGGQSPDVGVDVVFAGEVASDYFGIAVAGGGDFNNDGWGDIAVGAYKADWDSFSDAGKLYVYYGGPGGDTTADQLLAGEADGERFGYAVTMGDFTGDGVDDIAVGAYSFDGTEVNQGRIYVFNGNATPDAVPDHTITGVYGGDKFGWSLAGGLINNDAYTDIVMGTDGYVISNFSAGRVYVFDGGPTLDDVPSYTYDLGNAANDYLGSSVTAGVDINSDGSHDFMAGMPGNGSGGVSAGGAILFAGGASIAVDTTILGESANESLGQSVFFWPDFGSDGSSGIGFGGGATGYDDFRGRAKMYRAEGSGSGPCCLPPTLGDCDQSGAVDITDISVLIDNQFLTLTPLICDEEGDCDYSGVVDITDLSILIDNQFLTLTPLGPCP